MGLLLVKSLIRLRTKEKRVVKALISGTAGQDGSYLSELLLSKGYDVYGIVRRASVPRLDNIEHILTNNNFHLVEGDITDPSSINKIVSEVRPDEYYNLAAQSHVATSFEQPTFTFNVNTLGVLNNLEAIRNYSPNTKYYQASTSEQFGQNHKQIKITIPMYRLGETKEKISKIQDETVPFAPRSPYGVAKLAAHELVRVYRESYNIHASCGILFNHECLSEKTPILIRDNNQIRIVFIPELISLRRKGKSTQTFNIYGIEIWDGTGWTDIKCITANTIRDKTIHSIETRSGVVDATGNHKFILSDGQEKLVDDLLVGEELLTADKLPSVSNLTSVDCNLAEFLGLIVAEGYVSEKEISVPNHNSELLFNVARLWNKLFLGTTTFTNGISGFTNESINKINLTGGGQDLYRWLRSLLYGPDGYKRVPNIILNATIEVQNAFLKGYYAGDGLKAGNGQSITTNSPLLALGILWIYSNNGKKCSVYKEQRQDNTYYRLNILTNSNKGQHLLKNHLEIRDKKISNEQTDWVFDIETSSNKFMAGVGTVVVHNSERRGHNFVTRKITRWLGEFAKKNDLYIDNLDILGPVQIGDKSKLRLGNLSAVRDWGHAEDYVEAMYLMLQQKTPDDYVVATGEGNTVEDFLVEAFKVIHPDLDYRDFVITDPSLCRPAEVDFLQGSAVKARQKLGWKPKIAFKELVRRMVMHDMELASGKKL